MVHMAIKLLVFLLLATFVISAYAVSVCSTRRHIRVHSSGTDDSSCLSGGNYSCSTLAFVLENLTNCTNVSVCSEQVLTRQYRMNGLHDVDISGTENSTYISISCMNGTLTFSQARDISIRGLHWHGSCYNSNGSAYSTVCSHQAVLQFCNSSNIAITKCIFTSNTNRSAVHMVNMVNGDVEFESCLFLGDGPFPGGGVLLVQTQSNNSAHFWFVNCSFANCFSRESGGAIFFHLADLVTNNQLLVSNCSFIGNRAMAYGGHITINASGHNTNNFVWIYNSTFKRGHADFSGGALYIEASSKLSEAEIAIEFCNFSENSANFAGAVDFVQTNGKSFMKFSHCRFEKNTANFVTAVNFNIYPFFEHHHQYILPVVFTNCQWLDHYQSSLQSTGLGCIKTEQIPLIFLGTTLIIGTSDSPALYVGDTEVTLKGRVYFNKTGPAFKGGAIYLTGLSYINITRGLLLSFQSAHAVFGGAIYYESSAMFDPGSSYPCIFVYEGNYHNSSNWEAKIMFEDTHATTAGDSIFLHNFEVCSKEVMQNVFCNEHVFQGLNWCNGISSPPKEPLIFNAPARLIDNDTYSMDLTLGQTLVFNVTAVDILDHHTVATTTASLKCFSVKLNKVLVFSGGQSQTGVYLIGPENVYSKQQNCSLKFHTVSTPVISVTIELNITECHLGFVYNQERGTCVCAFPKSHAVICNRVSGFAFIQKGFWVGYPNEQYKNNTPVIAPCTENMCNFSHCPGETEEHRIQELCKLPIFAADQDKQCRNNHGGPYCTLCNNNSAFTFAAKRCIPKDHCTIENTIILTFLYLLFLVIVIVFFLFLLKMGLSVGSGYLYAYVYYFTVVPHFLTPFGISLILEYFISILNGFIFLSPDFLGLFPLCPLPMLNKLQYEVLSYVKPLFILSALLALGFIAKHWPRLLKLPERYTIRFLCTLILIFFTSLNQTNINVLTYISLNSEWRVYIQPDIPFFQVEGHMPFALLALAIEIVVLIPFTGLLLFEPLLVRWVNFVRIKPFLDNFQGCFRDNRRWMAGFYFLGRLILVVDMLSFHPTLFVEMLSIIFLFLIALLQPYRKRHLNFIDGFLMLNLCFVGIVTNHRKQIFIDIAVHLLVITAALYGIILFLTAAFKGVKKRTDCSRCLQWFKFTISSTNINEDSSETEEILHVQCRRLDEAAQYVPSKLRESLLSYQSVEAQTTDDLNQLHLRESNLTIT